MIDAAVARLKKIEQGQGGFKDDEPFPVAGIGVDSSGARPYQSDVRLLSHTRNPHKLIKVDGSAATEVLRSARPPLGMNPADRTTMRSMAQNSTVRRYLATSAIRTTQGFRITEDSIEGVDWKSSATSVPSNIEGVTVPTLIAAMGCHYFVVPSELFFERSGAKDKQYIAVEGATHMFTPCKPEYGDTRKRLFDYVDGWIAERFVCAGAACGSGSARGNELRVMGSGGFAPVYNVLAPAFEKKTGQKLATSYGPSMGASPEAIPNRLARGEPADVVILARGGLDALAKAGKVVQGSQVDLVRSRIGMAVKAGAPVPDISTVEALKRTLLAAKSIAYSDSASGVYLSTELFQRLGIAEQVAAKCKMIPVTPVGLIVARGEAEIGFQQMSELLAVEGIKVAGLIPEEVQRVTVFAAGVAANAKSPAAARQLIGYLASPKSAPVMRRYGLEPASGKKRRDKRAAKRPAAAAMDNHMPGIALFPVTSMSQVAIIGVNPPNSAVARL